jgi:ribosome-associated translation inhibitor RaiA
MQQQGNKRQGKRERRTKIKKMKELDFDIEFNSEGISSELENEFFVEADERLRKLAADHNDLRGAAINIREPAHGETSYLYEATAVIYARPNNIAASEKRNNPGAALKGALSAIEQQVRDKREKLGQPWKQPGQDPVTSEIIETELAEEV